MVRQEALELELVEETVTRYDTRRRRAEERGAETLIPPVQSLLRQSVKRMAAGIKDWRKKCKANRGVNPEALELLAPLKAEALALITCRVVLDVASRGLKYTRAANAVGHLIEDEIHLMALKKADPEWLEQIEKRAAEQGMNDGYRVSYIKRGSTKRTGPEFSWAEWDLKQRLHVGVTLLEIMIDSTAIVERAHHRLSKTRTEVRIRPTDEIVAWLEQSHERHKALQPHHLPCVSVPLDWNTPFDGGYHFQAALQRPFVKTHDREYLKELDQAEMDPVYVAINSTQRTAWEIDENVLEVLETLWGEGDRETGLPALDDILEPDRPEQGCTLEKRLEYNRTVKDIRALNNRHRSRRLALSKVINTARRYEKQGRFFYPSTFDFRGRMYPMSPFLQPQGDDVARGLLKFAEKQPLGDDGAYWLAVHGANCWGEDKLEFDSRVQWVERHANMIAAIHEDPLSNRAWTQADSPYQFLQFCLEWGEYLEDPETFESSIPVAMDASQNGIQIYSMLLRNEETGAATNCTPSESPADLYQVVADKATVAMLKDIENNHKHKAVLDGWIKWFGGRMPRGAVKRQVMVLPYGGTSHSNLEFLLEWYDDQHFNQGKENIWFKNRFTACRILTEYIDTAMRDSVKPAVECMDWLREVATVCTKDNIPIRWTSPSGFPVKQDYRKSKKNRIDTKVGFTLRRVGIREFLDQIAPKEQKNGLPPNYIHSLDAACMHLVATRMHDEGVRDFSFIHDSYAVHAGSVGLMHRTIRDVFVEVFSNDLLKDLKDEVQSYLSEGVTLPDPPSRGNLNINDLKEAKYFFA